MSRSTLRAIQATFTAVAGNHYTAVAIGSLKTAATNPLTLMLLVDRKS
jgi:hypothetical protein